MAKREKIIIIIAILALFYGVLDYFILSSDKNEPIQSETANQASKILEKIDNNLASLKIIEQKKNKCRLPDFKD